MGQTTPNIGIFIPSAGETNYEQSFAAGMMNIDQHDHSGGPNKGVPITTSGLADFSVTYDKLNSNVVDSTTGIGTQGGAFQNRLQLLGYLANLYQLSLSGTNVGFVAMNGGVSNVRTFQNSSSITWTNANGTGNPSAAVNIAGISPVPVANGGTGVTSLTPYAPILGGTTGTGPVQQPALGSAGDVLTSQGAGMPSVFASPGSLGQIQYATVTLTAAQIRNLSGTPIQIVSAPGTGKVIVPIFCYAFLNYVGTPFSSAGGSIALYYNSLDLSMIFTPQAFNAASQNVYTWCTQTQTPVSAIAGYPEAEIKNQPLTLSNNGSDYTGGGTSTVKFTLAYTVITLP